MIKYGNRKNIKKYIFFHKNNIWAFLPYSAMGEIFMLVKVVLPKAFWAWAGAAHIS